MGKAYLTYAQSAEPGPLLYGVTGTAAYWDEVTLGGTSDTFDGVVTCPFKTGGVAMVFAPDDNAMLCWGISGSTPDAASATRQLFPIPMGVPMYFNVPYGAYPAIKTLS